VPGKIGDGKAKEAGGLINIGSEVGPVREGGATDSIANFQLPIFD
jgi:hypothetical protein